MSSVKIVTDSASDIPPELIAELGITIVPLTVSFGAVSYIDVVELSVEKFWEMAVSSNELPQTGAPSIEAFHSAFENAITEGYTEILCVCLSSKLSATYQSAVKAAAKITTESAKIEVFDSLSATYGEGSIAVFAARNADLPLATLLDAVKDFAKRTRTFGALDTLDNLRRGGRIGAATAAFGSLLAIKPIIEIKDGVVEAHSKQRTRKRALDYILDLVRADADRIDSISVISANAPDTDEFTKQITEITKISNVLISTIGPVIGTHAGPRTIGVCFTIKPN